MKKIGSILFTLIFCITSFAQFTAKGPSVVGINEGFTISFTINATNPKHFQPPKISGGIIIGGPYQSQSSYMSNINGNISSSNTITWTYSVKSGKPGTIIVHPAKVQINNKTYVSNSLKIEVSNNAGYSNRNYSQQGNYHNYQYQQRSQTYNQPYQRQNNKNTDIQIDNKAMFVSAVPNKTNVVKGEEVIITYKLYTLVPVSEYQIEKIPSSSGFWIEELDRQTNPVLKYETYNGQRYQVADLRKVIVYPQKTGHLTIKPMSISIIAQIPTRSKEAFSTGDPFFDQFFSNMASIKTSYQRIEKKIYTNSIALNVKDLPQKNKDYCCGVGKSLNISSSISTQNLKAFDAFYLTYTLTGSGNLTLINNLPINLPDEFQISDPEIIDNLTRNATGLSGTRTFRYLVIPSVQGKFQIPDLKISYYNTLKNSYETISAQGYTMHIAKGDTSSSFAQQLDKRAKYRNMDIIKEKTLYGGNNEYHIFDSLIIIIIPIIIIVLLTIAIIIFSNYRKMISDVDGMKLRKATKVATKRLKKAKRLLDKNDMISFEDEVSTAIWNYLLDRFKIDKTKLSIQECKYTLSNIGVDNDTIQKLGSTLELCQYLRFSQDKAATADLSLYEDAITIIISIEQQMKNLKKIKHYIQEPKPEHEINIPTIIIIAFLVSLFSFYNANAQKTYSYQQADNYYNTKEYDSAIVAYTFLANQMSNANAYSSLAATYFRKSNYANAMLYYEKALKLSPNNKTIKLNINITRARLVGDTYIMPEFFLIRWAKNIAGLLSIPMWSILFIVLFIFTCIFIFAYLFTQKYKVTTFYLALLFLILSISSLCFGIVRQNIQNENSHAIIMKSNIHMRQKPNNSAKDVHILYKGQKIKIVEENDTKWLMIMTEDNKEGYIKNENYKRI